MPTEAEKIITEAEEDEIQKVYSYLRYLRSKCIASRDKELITNIMNDLEDGNHREEAYQL